MNMKACISDGVLGTQECSFIPWLLCGYFENVKNIFNSISAEVLDEVYSILWHPRGAFILF